MNSVQVEVNTSSTLSIELVPVSLAICRIERDFRRQRRPSEGAQRRRDDVQVRQAGRLDELTHDDGQDDLGEVVGQVQHGHVTSESDVLLHSSTIVDLRISVIFCYLKYQV